MTNKLVPLAAALLLPLGVPASAQMTCDEAPVMLQVLGSGGPSGVGRASAGYLIWIDGVSRIMVDAGGGTFTRFHEAGARIGDLDLLALSHFHPDHSSEVPALFWIKTTSLKISGPSGSAGFPSLDEYVSGLFGTEGVFRAVSTMAEFETATVDVSLPEPTEVFSEGTVRVRGLGVPHGNVPAIGYRVDIGDVSVAFSSDQNGSDPAFAEFASGVNVLVVHAAVREQATGIGSRLHAKPSVWGQMATNAAAKTLVLSHLSGIVPRDTNASVESSEGQRPRLSERLANVRSRYSGPVITAEDLMCIPIVASGGR